MAMPSCRDAIVASSRRHSRSRLARVAARSVPSVVEKLEERRLLAVQPTAQLIDAAADKPIARMVDGMTIDMAAVGTRLSINAFPDGPAGSIRFLMDGNAVRTENYAPYSIAGDAGTDFYSWTPPLGTHKLQIQQFSGSNGGGSLLGATTLSFTVLSSQRTPAPLVSPPPASPPPAASTGSTSDPIKINFQPSWAATVSGYIMDAGQTYGSRSGHTYGWSTSHTDVVVDRGVNSNQVLDTNVGVKAKSLWNLAVPNGTYVVKVGVGDAGSVSNNNIWLEDQNNIFNYVGLGANQFLARSATIAVNDGALTIGVGGSASGATRINYLELVGQSPSTTVPPASPPVSPPPAPAGARAFNFQPASTPSVSGYIVDGGNTFGSRNGQTYGWTINHTDSVVDRNSNGDQRLDTNVGVKAGSLWEVAVPNGAYSVKVSVGDSEATSKNNVWIEGTNNLFNYTSLSVNQFLARTATVNVTDGKLSIGVGGSTSGATRINYVEVSASGTSPPASPPLSPPPPTSPPPLSGDSSPTPMKGPMNSGSPTAVLKVVGSTTGVAGMPVVVNGADSSLPNSVLYASYQWDFGDPNGAYNRLPGWTAGHIYDKPGTYTVRLTVTDANGQSSSATTTINVTSDTRRTVYVDAVSGNDGNNGSLNAPIRSFGKAASLATNNVKILFKRGQSWNTNYWLSVGGANVHIGAYGSGANPVLNVISNTTAIQTFGGSSRTLIENITFDSPYKPSGNVADKIGVNGIFVGGTNVAIRGCTFLNLDDGVNANGHPNGLIFQDNDAPLATGVRGYMLWTEGSDIVALGNYAANSTREHNMRIRDGHRLLIAYNNFTNLSRESVDKSDIRKGTIEMQRGSWAYIYGNTVKDGPIRVGPRGEATEPSSTRTNWVVVDNNKISNYQLNVYPGTQHLMIRNNVIKNDAQSAIGINPWDPQGRPLTNVHIIANTAYNNATTGRFLRVEGGLHDNTITLGQNKYIMPKMVVGSNNTVGVSVAAHTLSGFRSIYNNIWPVPQDSSKYAEGGVMWVYPNYIGQVGYKDQQEWYNYSQTNGDVFKNI